MATVVAGDGFPVAILKCNEPVFYCIPAMAYETLMDKIDDMELNAVTDGRLKDGRKLLKVRFDEL